MIESEVFCLLNLATGILITFASGTVLCVLAILWKGLSGREDQREERAVESKLNVSEKMLEELARWSAYLEDNSGHVTEQDMKQLIESAAMKIKGNRNELSA
ncbi:MAG: hypothetical protein FWD25_05955 [Clostridia bacterium]|nr:hypothetical protein [Clostridia bacterium]